MDKTTLDKLKQELIEEKKILLEKIAEIAGQADVADPSDTMDERAQGATNDEERHAIEQSLELRLKEIEETLEALGKGTYGTCKTCKSPIEPKRIVAMPAVQTCMSCAEKSSLA